MQWVQRLSLRHTQNFKQKFKLKHFKGIEAFKGIETL